MRKRAPKGGGLWYESRVADPIEYRGGQFLPIGGHFWSFAELDRMACEYHVMNRLDARTRGDGPYADAMGRIGSGKAKTADSVLVALRRRQAMYEAWEYEEVPKRRAILWDAYQGGIQLALAPPTI